MKIKHHLIILLLSCIALTTMHAQNVSNVRVQQEGRDIAVYYDLDGRADIKISASADTTLYSNYIPYSKSKSLKINSEYVEGDIGKDIEAGERKRIIWHVLDDKKISSFKRQNIVFTVSASAPYRTFILAQGAYSFKPSQYSAGLMIGGVRRFGWYIKARSSFQFSKYEGDLNNLQENYLSYYLSGKTKPMQWVFDAGLVARILNKNTSMLYLYAGLGYGERYMMYQTMEDKWLCYRPTTAIGISADIGLMWAIKGFSMSLGASSISTNYVDVQLGIGYMFNY